MVSSSKIYLGVLALAAVVIGTGGCDAGRRDGAIETRTAAVDGQFTIDLTGPIGQRWQKLGGAAVMGDATSAVVSMSQVPAQYQTFANFVIVYSQDVGAVVLSQLLFDKWVSLASGVVPGGTNLLTYVGVPMKDYGGVPGTVFQAAEFARGRIVFAGTGPWLISGKILETAEKIATGFPTSDEAGGFLGVRWQTFQNGTMYWTGDGNTPALYVSNEILDRYYELGGPLGPLGFPTSSTEPIKTFLSQAVIGTVSHFTNGAIYYTPFLGAAREVMGDIYNKYQNELGGPTGWLGFPTSGQGTSAIGDKYNDFVGGVLVNHLADDTARGVQAFGDGQLYIERLQGRGDCPIGCGSGPDIYARVLVWTGNLTLVGRRIPEEGYFNTASVDLLNGTGTFPLHKTMNSAFRFQVGVSVWDVDDTTGDDDLGDMYQEYSIDNLWGKLVLDEHSDRDATAKFTIQAPPPYDYFTDVRGQKFWSFHNFKTHTLTPEQFETTFSDIGPGETAFVGHPFNFGFYMGVYKKIARHNNCFGMVLESYYAELNESLYVEPIFDYFPDTQNGEKLTDDIDGNGIAREAIGEQKHGELMDEINLKQGYQLGRNSAIWFLAESQSGQTHDPVGVFTALELLDRGGGRPLLSLMHTLSSGEGKGRKHTIRPYKYEKLDGQSCANTEIQPSANCWRIYVANPDLPKGAWAADDYIEIDPDNNLFYYQDDYLPHDPPAPDPARAFQGSAHNGAHMVIMPFGLFEGPQVTPLASLDQRIENTVLTVVSGGGKVKQVSSPPGTLFDEQVGDVRESDDPARLTDVVPLPVTNGDEDDATGEVFFARPAPGVSHAYDVEAVSGVAGGTPVEVTVASGWISSYFSIPSTPGKPDRISTIAMGTPDKAMALTIASDSEAKSVIWLISGPDRNRWTRHDNLAMAPGQTIKVRLDQGATKLVYENDGPPTGADVTVQGDPGTSPIVVGHTEIPTGTTTVELRLPSTTLSLSDGVGGNAGWLTAAPTVTLTAQDNSGTGIAAIEYGPDGVNWTTYTGPFSYTTEGASTLYYRARDNAGDQEPPKTHDFKLDKRRPATTGSVSTTAG
jgi:LGFP repeat